MLRLGLLEPSEKRSSAEVPLEHFAENGAALGSFAALRMTPQQEQLPHSNQQQLERATNNLYAFLLRLPDEFVDLQAEAGAEVVGKHPLGKVRRIEQAVLA